MKTVLTAYLPDTNVELSFSSNGEQLWLNNQKFGAAFNNERDYVNGVLDAIQAFTKFKVTHVEE